MGGRSPGPSGRPPDPGPGGGGGARGPHIGASDAALADIPPGYLARYVTAAGTCPALSWQVLAAIGKVESDHGRSSAPGVRDGINRAGCCAGPMQFNLTNGPPSTWDTWGTGVRAHVYDPAHAVPAAARKLCGDGLARPEAVGRDPCPQVLGSAALHTALRRYNNACWYVHEVDPGRPLHPGRPRPGPVPRPVRPRPGRQPPDHDHGQPRLRPQDRPGLRPPRPTGPVPAGRPGRAAHDPPQLPALGPLPLRQGHHPDLQPHRLASRGHRHGRRPRRQPPQPPRPHPRPWLTASRAPCAPPRSARRSPFGRRPYFTDEGHQGHVHIGYGAPSG